MRWMLLLTIMAALVAVPAAIAAPKEASGALAFTPSSVNLGGVNLGSTRETNVILTNVGDEALVINGWEAFGTNGNFLINPGTCTLGSTLSPEENCMFALQTTPVRTGRINGTFCFTVVGYTIFDRECATVRGHALPR